jgi:hypothetical protein
VLAAALSATPPFMDHASTRCDTPVISPRRPTQNVRCRHRLMSREPDVSPDPGVPPKGTIRGGAEVTVMAQRARLDVDAPHKKRCGVALQDERETEERESVAADLSWRTLAMVQGSTLRWLVEVFLEDWKSSAGWGQLTTQPDAEGASRSLILSLRLEHCLRCHPHQRARLEHTRPACTVGSLQAQARADLLWALIRELLFADNPQEPFNRLSHALEEGFQLAPSQTPMTNRNLGRLEPTPALQYRAEVA